MIFDGSEIQLKDSVFDVAYGSGHIVEINEKTKAFRVSFAGRTFTYSPNGHGTFPRKTLYWRAPVAYIPAKNDDNWAIFSRIQEAVAKELGQLK